MKNSAAGLTYHYMRVEKKRRRPQSSACENCEDLSLLSGWHANARSELYSTLRARSHRPQALFVCQDEIADDPRADGDERVRHELPSARLECRACEDEEPAHQRENRRERIQPHPEGQLNRGLPRSQDEQANRVADKLDQD